MNTTQIIAKRIVAEMRDIPDTSTCARLNRARIALMDYRLFLLGRKSYADLCLVRAKAMESGVSEQLMIDKSYRMRQLWAAGKLR